MNKPKLYEIRYKIALLLFFLIIGLTLIYILVFSSKGGRTDIILTPNMSHTLSLGETKRINSQTSVRLKSISPMPPKCNDCFEETTIMVIADGEQIDLDYRFGGFAGVVTEWQAADGIEIKVLEIGKSGIRFEYRKRITRNDH